ncbi:MAG: hypothetical protein ABW185_01720 [Sedimenticola sp.]
MGNPFLEDGTDLLKLDTRDILDPGVVTTVRQAEDIGQRQYNAFVTERLEDRSTPITEPIKKNKLALFSRPLPKQKSKSSMQISSMKSDISLFSRLYVGCQTRDGNLNEFFRHENQSAPPSLSQLGKIRLGTKSDLLSCLESCVDVADDIPLPATDVVILDGAAVVNFLKPQSTNKTFSDYAAKVFVPYVQGQMQRSSRVDIVWDQYHKNSLKSHARSKRGKGVRRRVAGATGLPGNWQQFLRVDANKTELFAFLTDHVKDLETSKHVISTKGTGVVSNLPFNADGLAPCNHEEADTRMMLHLTDAVSSGFQRILLSTVDTDVVVLAIAAADTIGVEQLWVAFGTAQHHRYIPVHEIAALPVFHAYTGCDTVSSFATKGKKTAWDTWKAFDNVTVAFRNLSKGPAHICDDDMDILERFTILLYDRTSSKVNIDDARQELFTKKGRAMEAIPPTRAALVQHTKRATYQGEHCWGNASTVNVEMPSPEDWGWIDPENWKPVWTTLPEASASSRELIRCGCTKGCKGRCNCKKAALKCTALCNCGGRNCEV